MKPEGIRDFLINGGHGEYHCESIAGDKVSPAVGYALA
jgi:hypothetical protein